MMASTSKPLSVSPSMSLLASSHGTNSVVCSPSSHCADHCGVGHDVAHRYAACPGGGSARIAMLPNARKLVYAKRSAFAWRVGNDLERTTIIVTRRGHFQRSPCQILPLQRQIWPGLRTRTPPRCAPRCAPSCVPPLLLILLDDSRVAGGAPAEPQRAHPVISPSHDLHRRRISIA